MNSGVCGLVEQKGKFSAREQKETCSNILYFSCNHTAKAPAVVALFVSNSVSDTEMARGHENEEEDETFAGSVAVTDNMSA